MGVRSRAAGAPVRRRSTSRCSVSSGGRRSAHRGRWSASWRLVGERDRGAGEAGRATLNPTQRGDNAIHVESSGQTGLHATSSRLVLDRANVRPVRPRPSAPSWSSSRTARSSRKPSAPAAEPRAPQPGPDPINVRVGGDCQARRSGPSGPHRGAGPQDRTRARGANHDSWRRDQASGRVSRRPREKWRDGRRVMGGACRRRAKRANQSMKGGLVARPNRLAAAGAVQRSFARVTVFPRPPSPILTTPSRDTGAVTRFLC